MSWDDAALAANAAAYDAQMSGELRAHGRGQGPHQGGLRLTTRIFAYGAYKVDDVGCPATQAFGLSVGLSELARAFTDWYDDALRRAFEQDETASGKVVEAIAAPAWTAALDHALAARPLLDVPGFVPAPKDLGADSARVLRHLRVAAALGWAQELPW